MGAPSSWGSVAVCLLMACGTCVRLVACGVRMRARVMCDVCVDVRVRCARACVSVTGDRHGHLPRSISVVHVHAGLIAPQIYG